MKTRLFASAALIALLLGSCTLIDSTPPVIAIDSPTDGQQIAADAAAILVSGTAADDKWLNSVEVKLDGGEYSAVEGLGTWNYVLTGVEAGTHVISAKATDMAGNIGYAYRSFSKL
jgi:hypothetical protein